MVGLEREGFKLGVGDDGIVRLDLGKVKLDKVILEGIAKEYKEIAKGLPDKPDALVDLSMVIYNPSSTFRKRIVDSIIDLYKDPGFGRLAVWGVSSKFAEVLASLVIIASRMKNIKFFKTEEEALKWLKEELKNNAQT